ncbi:MAG: hypothetical protein E6H78_04320 [Betaproteobacteria bacterium]|nr:MAG: hypothetical protein E6H78_04320 [Betaproteobacteria bacterium]
MLPRTLLLAITWCACACCWCILVGSGSAAAATLSTRAKESGCTGRPTRVEGSTYKCVTQSGYTAYFNVPGMTGEGDGGGSSSRGGPSPSGFPKVDATTQRGRDDIRRKVLNEELVAEQKLLEDARAAYSNGAPPPTAEEQNVPQKYGERVSRLRQALSLHEKNIDALKKELARH